MQPLFQFWGKAHDSCAPRWHPLVYHSLDVAAVAQTYLKTNPLVLKQLAGLSGLTPEVALSLTTFLAGAHDVGKFGPGFQAKVPELLPALFAGQPVPAEVHDHQVMGVSLLVGWLASKLPGPAGIGRERTLERIANLACAHHGRPVMHLAGLFRYAPEAQAVAVQYLESLAALVGIESLPAEFFGARERIRQFSWLAAGVITLADWVGSSRAWFPYQVPSQGLEDYFEATTCRAQAALKASRLTETVRAHEGGFTNLFARSEDSAPKIPTPLQAYADTVPLPQGVSPQMFYLEDETGAGKTEAALTLASRLLAAGFARGIFFCLPTQTTANAVFKRIAPLTRYLFASADEASVSLAHGQSTLALDTLRQDEAFTESLSSQLGGWAQERNKTALLADLGVGTIDQVVLAGLPARHASLRTLGLAQKVLIIDEAHACDTYQLGLLSAVLEEHARLGGSVIILSATLPRAAKEQLATAFNKGLCAPAVKLHATAYPLATHVSAAHCVETPIAARGAPRTLRFKPVTDKQVPELVAGWLGEGKCVCLLRNTVTRAQEQFDFFNERFPGQVRLVHARFMNGHRIQNDLRLLHDFGKDSSSKSRAGQLVIATQVVEASLDIDFDEMVTDIAPVDSLLQRAGRWRRHTRDLRGNRASEEGRAASPVHVVTPDPNGEGFIGKLPQGTMFVYPNMGVLWRTAQIVMNWKALVIPAQVREAVEFAYQEGEVPNWLERADEEHKGTVAAKRQLAYGSVVKWEEGYHPSAGIEEGERAVTRLGEASATVVLSDGGGLPLIGGHNSMVLSQLSVRHQRVGGGELVEGRIWLHLKRDENTSAWIGESQEAQPGNRRYGLRYSAERGLSFF